MLAQSVNHVTLDSVKAGITLPFLQDHPHACGDKAICSAYRHGGIGSSPRVWGQVLGVMAFKSSTRIIPTRVGTSFFHVCLSDSGEDHPHACGDKSRCQLGIMLCGGSSPRVWGQVYHLRTSGCRCWSRIIPTRVGTSLPYITG